MKNLIANAFVKHKLLLPQIKSRLRAVDIKRKLQKLSKGTKKACVSFLKPTLIIASPYIGMALGAKTKNAKIGAATSDNLKVISGGRILSFKDKHGHGLRLKDMRI